MKWWGKGAGDSHLSASCSCSLWDAYSVILAKNVKGQLYLVTSDTEHNHAALSCLSSSGHTVLHCRIKEVTADELLLLKFSEAGIPMSLL